MPKVLLETHGCTLNQADSDIMQDVLERSGFSVAREDGGAARESGCDFVIMNTCTVKKATEQRITELVRRRAHMGSRLVVTGCMASANRDIIEKAAPEASILSTDNVSRIGDALAEIVGKGRVLYGRQARQDKALHIPTTKSAIARIPISEGCLSSCAFCETRHARGPLNSFSEELILKAIERNVRSGAREIELTSQDVGAYGADRGTGIASLVSRAALIEGEFMMRIGMLNPEHLHRHIDGLADVLSGKKTYRFVHLPVQSGSDRILAEMGRRYTVKQFCGYVRELRERVPEVCIETDLIVGYPGETEDDFDRTVAMVEELKPTITNISRYGARPHAPASGLEQLDGAVVKERSARLAGLVKQMQHDYFAGFRGRKVRALLTEANGRSITGRTDSYLQVAVDNCSESDIGKWVEARVTGNSYACIIGSSVAGPSA